MGDTAMKPRHCALFCQVIELDGGQHGENGQYDRQRDACLQANGFVVLRFWNNEVRENTEGVLEAIRRHCLHSTSPTP